jgi:ribosomal protein S13
MKQEITGTDGGAIQHEQIDLSRLTEAELVQLEAIVNSAQSWQERLRVAIKRNIAKNQCSNCWNGNNW